MSKVNTHIWEEEKMWWHYFPFSNPATVSRKQLGVGVINAAARLFLRIRGCKLFTPSKNKLL